MGTVCMRQGPAHDGLRAKSSLPPVSVTNVGLGHANPIRLGIVCGYFHRSTAGIGSCKRPHGM